MKLRDTRKAIRQGDIVAVPILGSGLPTIKIKDHDGIIQYGETTGHRHHIDPAKAEFYEDSEGRLIIEIIEDTLLIHSGPDGEPTTELEDATRKDVHLALPIREGYHRIVREREIDPFKKNFISITD